MRLSQQMVLVAGLLLQRACSVQLNFGVEQRFGKMCFYERINKGVESYLEYQVIVGDSNRIDLKVTGPNKQVVYAEQNKYEDTFTWTAAYTGAYSFCFSSDQFHNSHKLIYFDLEVGDDNAVVGQNRTQGKPMTLMETASVNIHGLLNKVSYIQTYFRNREAGGRQFAEELNVHVILWSLGETIAVLVIGLGQVLVLRSFFSAPSPRSGTSFANGRIST